MKCSWIFQRTENIGSTDPNLFEGDMTLTPEQKAAVMAGQDVDAPVTRGSINRGTWKGGVMYYKIDRGLSKSRILLNIGLNVYRSHRDDFNTFARHVLLVRSALRMCKHAYLFSVSICPCYQGEFLNSRWIFKSPMTDNHHAEKAD